MSNETKAAVFFAVVAALVLLLLYRVLSRAGRQLQKQLAKLPDFEAETSYFNRKAGLAVAIDKTRQVVAFATRKRVRSFSFREIMKAEIERNGVSIQSTDRGSQMAGAVVGAVLLGPIGALVGGLTGSKRKTETVKGLALRIYTSDIQQPLVTIPFFDNRQGAQSDDKKLQSAARLLDEWHGRFQAILHNFPEAN